MITENDLRGVRVIVTNAESRLGLYVIRALGRAGCKVTALAGEQASKRVLGFSSRFVSEQHLLPPVRPPLFPPALYQQALIAAIETLAARHDVLVPVSTLSISAVAEHAARFESKLRFYIPPLEIFQTANDKESATKIAKEIGIPVPETYYGLDPITIEEWAMGTKVKFPLVVKLSGDMSDLLSPADRYRIVQSVDELTQEYRRLHQIRPYPLVQEFIQGEGYGFFTITESSGKPIATFCHRRLRENPPSGGPSTLCESIYDKTLVGLGSQLLQRLHWKGVAMVEFRYDCRENVYKFLEINPRFWGSLPLAIQCGVNFPVYLVKMALGIEPTTNGDYPVGRKMRFFFSDFCAVMGQLQNGKKLSVGLGYIRELCDFSIKDGLFEKDDLRPTMRYVLSKLAR